MNIHPIETGKVKITSKWRVGEGAGLKRLLNTLLDDEFTGWLPIYTWVVEHPEGLIVVDTGAPADANRRQWFPPFMPLVQRAAKFDVTPEQEVGPGLRRLGYRPEDVRWVVLTHLHQDHDGGLHHFPAAEFIVARQEWAAAAGFKGRMNGYLNQRWPAGFQPRLIDFVPDGDLPFAGSFALTAAGDIQLVPTPGHSAGHLSVIVQEGARAVFIAGDASYSEELLLAGQPDGIGHDPAVQLATHQRIRDFAAAQPTVYLPSHDPDGAARLAARQPMPRVAAPVLVAA